MSARLESGLLLTARILVLMLPLCLLGGRVAGEAALSLIALLFVARSVLARDWAWTRTVWFKVGVGLWLWMLVVSVFALDPALSFSQAAPWLRFLIFAAARGAWVLDELWMRRLLWSVTGVVTFVAADVWLQYATGTDLFGHQRPSDERLSGPFDGLRAGIFIAKLMFPVVLGAFLWQAWQRPAKKLLLVALPALLVRGLLGGVMVCAVMSVVVLAFADLRMLQRHVAQTAATAESLRDSPYGQIWHSALHLAGERPLVGVGMKNFRIACEDTVLGLPASMTLRCATHPHNLYLEWLAEAGVPGLAGFLMLVAVWLRQIWQGYRAVPLNLWLFGPLVALALHLWPLGPSGSFFSNWFGAIFWLCLGWALAALRLQERPR